MCYNQKGFELFSKMNVESSWAFESKKLSDYVFCATLLVSGIDLLVLTSCGLGKIMKPFFIVASIVSFFMVFVARLVESGSF